MVTIVSSLSRLGTLFSREKFVPKAYYSTLNEVVVITKDCSYTAERISDLAELFWENHRPWYAPWKKCVGCRVWCPLSLGFLGVVLVRRVLDWAVQRPTDPLGPRQPLFYSVAGDLTVRISS